MVTAAVPRVLATADPLATAMAAPYVTYIHLAVFSMLTRFRANKPLTSSRFTMGVRDDGMRSVTLPSPTTEAAMLIQCRRLYENDGVSDGGAS
jgi:hypothetical protein